jgi:carboxylesterase type B
MRAFAICLSIASATPTFAQSATSTRVQIEAGTLVGSSDAGVLSFKGIPFAAPPAGVHRRPPLPGRENGMRHATATTVCNCHSQATRLRSVRPLPRTAFTRTCGGLREQ